MSMSDPIGDMLTRIRNGQSARKSVVSSPASRFRQNVLEVLLSVRVIFATIQLRRCVPALLS